MGMKKPLSDTRQLAEPEAGLKWEEQDMDAEQGAPQ